MTPEETNKELVPEKMGEIKDEGPKFHCEQSDVDVVNKLAQMFLTGLATACVDNTTGAFFSRPGSVAAELRKEMEAYLIQRSESFVAESVVLEGGAEAEVSGDPYDIISNFVDDFATSKRTLFGRVSTWLLNDQQEDKIDDFVQEIEINGFWLTDRRATLAQTLLKNVDFKTAFHCDEKFNSLEELTQHLPHCKYRSLTCQNESCDAIFSACHLQDHDSLCPFKFIPCEQKCSQTLMRRDMDRHCITVCPMRLVNCPFHSVGCQSAIPHCTIEQHCSSDLNSHLLHILQGIYKEASEDNLKQRIKQLEKASSSSQLANAKDIRSLTSVVKGLESKLGPMKFSVKHKDNIGDRVDSTDGSISNNIENKDNSNIKNTDAESDDAENIDAKVSNHTDNRGVNNHNFIENKDGCYGNDVESKDSNDISKIENMHGISNGNIDKNQGSNGSTIEHKYDSNRSQTEIKHSSSSEIIENNVGTDIINIENAHVSNINDIESSEHGTNNSYIENTDGNHISHIESKQTDESSKVENRDVNNTSNIEEKDDTISSNIRKHNTNSSNVENRDGWYSSEIEDKHGNDNSEVENGDVNNISNIANIDGGNKKNIKKDDNNSNSFEDRDGNDRSTIENKGGNNSHKVNNSHDSSKVDNMGGNSNSIENRDSSSSDDIENMDSNISKEAPSSANSSA